MNIIIRCESDFVKYASMRIFDKDKRNADIAYFMTLYQCVFKNAMISNRKQVNSTKHR